MLSVRSILSVQNEPLNKSFGGEKMLRTLSMTDACSSNIATLAR